MTLISEPRIRTHFGKFTYLPLLLLCLVGCSTGQKSDQPVPPSVSETTVPPTSSATIPVETFELVSWNVQTFGKVQGPRADGFSRVFPKLLDDKVWVFAAEEVARQESADVLTSWLP